MGNKLLLALVAAATIAAWFAGPARADLTFLDLTHEIPTFAPLAAEPTKPDLSKPVGSSAPVPGFYHQAVLYPADLWATDQGYFLSAAILIQEHNGTSFNSPNHYVNDAESLEPGGIPPGERKAAEALTVAQLTGRIVLVDVSDRVDAELARNGGRPSPDTAVTDFSDSSRATVRAEDIEAIADQIEDGVWVVARLGWSRFYGVGGADWNESAYVNGLNHPGFTGEAIDRLIAVMDRKGVTIAGIAADSLSSDSGQGAKGTDENWSQAWPAHVRLYQRGVLIVENLTNLEALAARHGQGNCTLVVGAIKHIGGTGGPARVLAACETN